MKKISTLLDVMFAFANTERERFINILETFSYQKNLLFPETDTNWADMLCDIAAQDDSVDLLKAFQYEINDYLDACKAENPEAYNARQMHAFYDEDVFVEQPRPTIEEIWGYTDEDVAWLPALPLMELEEACIIYALETGLIRPSICIAICIAPDDAPSDVDDAENSMDAEASAAAAERLNNPEALLRDRD